MNHSAPAATLSRRQFLNRSAVTGAALTASASVPPTGLLAASSNEKGTTMPPAGSVKPGEFPGGTLGSLKVSRLISGGNIISGWCHARDLLFVRPLAQAYLTEAKQFDTLQRLEEAGVNAIVIDMIQVEIVRKYRRERGGRLQMIVGVRQEWGDWINPNWADLRAKIRESMEQGADALFVHGGYADRLAQSGQADRVTLMGRAVQFIREQRFPAGLGAHALETLVAADQQGVRPDFYFKTFHHDRYWSATPRARRKPFCVDGPRQLDHDEFHDNIFCLDAEATAEFMLDKPQPWIAFKVLAAGAIQPASGFQFAFENGADFVAVGMFDFEVAEDVQAAREALKGIRRERRWCG